MKRFLFLALAAFLLVGCSSSDGALTGQATHDTYTAFSAPEQGFRVGNGLILASDTVVYKNAWYSVDGAAWQPLVLSGNAYGASSSWLSGAASIPLPAALSGPGEHYVIVYSCSRVANVWDCHGGTPGSGGWQLQVFAGGSGATRYLVQGGVGRADIVVSPDAPNMVKLAADIFQTYIYNMTGATLPIVNAPGGGVPFHVYIGRSSYTDAMGITAEGCVNDGFKTVSGENYLVLLGEDTPSSIAETGPNTYAEWDALTGEDRWKNDYLDSYGGSYNTIYSVWEEDGRGSMNAVYEFLYSQGMRWYHPGWYEYPGLGTIIPEKQDIGFQDVNSLTNPEFPLREFYMYSMGFAFSPYHYDGMFEETFRWQLALRGNSYYDFIVGSSSGPAHGILGVISRQETKIAHPEYYARMNGVLKNGSWPVPDLCSSELLEANIRYVRTLFDVYNVSTVSVMPSDGFTQASDQCRYKETTEREYAGWLSDYVWEYVNNVAWAVYETHPDKKVICGAYGFYALPPLHLSRPLAPNIVVVVGKNRPELANEEMKERFENLTNAWLELLDSDTIYTYDFYLHNDIGRNTQNIPYFFPHVAAENLQFLKGKSNGEMIEISSTTVWPPYEFNDKEWTLEWDLFAANSFNTYITSRLYWDTELDMDALLEEYYVRYYGPAKEEMEAFLEYTEANTDRVLKDPEVLRTMRRMILDAREAAGENDYGHRIDLWIGLMESRGPDEITIDSCQTLDYPVATYRLTADVSSVDTCFTINNVGVTLDCQGHSIAYSTDGGDSEYGVVVPYSLGTYASTIKNCNIKYTGPSVDNAAIMLAVSTDATIENSTINTTNSKGIWITRSWNMTIVGNTIFSDASQAIFAQEVSTGTILNNNLSSRAGQGIFFYETNNVVVAGNNASSVSNNGLLLALGGNNIIRDNRLTSVTNAGLRESQTTGNIFLRNIVLP